MKEEEDFKGNPLYFNMDKYPNEVRVVNVETTYGYLSLIASMGSHPCAYIAIPKMHPIMRFYVDYDEIDLPVHGGITYSGNDLWYTRRNHLHGEGMWVKSEWQFLEGEIRNHFFWIGWDYAHSGDVSWYPTLDSPLSSSDRKIWKLKEIQVCVQMAKIELKRQWGLHINHETEASFHVDKVHLPSNYIRQK